MSGLSDRSGFYLDAVNVFLMVAASSRVDRALLSNKSLLWKVVEKVGQEPSPPPKAFLRMAAQMPSFYDKILSYTSDPNPSKCSEIGRHVLGGHDNQGTSKRAARHFT